MKATLISCALIFSVILSMAAFQTGKKAPAKYFISKTVDLKKGNETIYTYTADGRIAAVRGRRATTSYEYTTDMVIKKLSDSAGHILHIDTMWLNVKGLAAKMHDNRPGSDNDFTFIEYDSAGYSIADRVEYKHKIMLSEEQKYRGGNKISLKQMGADQPNIITYSYYPDQLNTIENDNMGMDFLGHSSRNALRESMSVSGKDTAHGTCFYHYDDLGRIIIRACYAKSKLADSTGYSYY
jgi:hypothetical protein